MASVKFNLSNISSDKMIENTKKSAPENYSLQIEFRVFNISRNLYVFGKIEYKYIFMDEETKGVSSLKHEDFLEPKRRKVFYQSDIEAMAEKSGGILAEAAADLILTKYDLDTKDATIFSLENPENGSYDSAMRHFRQSGLLITEAKVKQLEYESIKTNDLVGEKKQNEKAGIHTIISH